MSGAGKNMPEMLDLPSRATFGDVTYPAGGQFGPRLQRDVQVFVVHSGSACLVIDRTITIDVGPGESLLLAPGREENFRFSRTEPTRHGWCHLDFGSVAPPQPESLIFEPQAVTASALALIDLGISIGDMGGYGRLARVVGAALLAAIHGSAPEANGAGVAPKPVLRALDFIRSHLGNEVSLPDIATAAGTSAGNLRRLFQLHLGMSPMQMVWRRRVEVGIGLLQSTGLSVGEIAYRVGFKSPFHFSRRVNFYTGSSPSALRIRHWNVDRN